MASDSSIKIYLTNCGICSKHYSNPLMLPCLHSFCRKCIEHQGSSVRQIKCPICGTVSTLTNGKASSLPNNLWLAHQMKVSTFRRKVEGMEKSACQRCVNRDNRSAVALCCNCHLFMCSLCKDDHQCCKETMDHQLVDICERKSIDLGSIFSDAMFPRKPVMCSKHDREELKFFCEDCQCLVCRDCVVIEHSNHKKNYMEEKRKNELSDLLNSLSKANNGLHELDSAITSVKKMKQQINERKSQVNKEITKSFKEIYSALQTREQQMHARNEKIAIAKLTCLDMQLDKFNAHKERMVFATELVSRTTDYTATELLSTKKTLQQQLEDTLTTLKQLDMEPAENDNIYISVDKAIEQVSKLGRVSGLVDPAQCTEERPSYYSGLRTATVGKEKTLNVTLKDNEGILVNGKVPISGILKNKQNNSFLMIKGQTNAGLAVLKFTPVAAGNYELNITVGGRSICGCPRMMSVDNCRRW